MDLEQLVCKCDAARAEMCTFHVMAGSAALAGAGQVRAAVVAATLLAGHHTQLCAHNRPSPACTVRIHINDVLRLSNCDRSQTSVVESYHLVRRTPLWAVLLLCHIRVRQRQRLD